MATILILLIAPLWISVAISLIAGCWGLFVGVILFTCSLFKRK